MTGHLPCAASLISDLQGKETHRVPTGKVCHSIQVVSAHVNRQKSDPHRTLNWLSKCLQVGVIVFVAAALATFSVSYLVGWDSWDGSQWAAGGAWFGGLMTFGAVTVALIQTAQSRSHADDAKKEAHRLLATELDAQRRDHQVDALSQVWDAIGEFVAPTTEFTGRLESIFLAQREVQRYRPGDLNAVQAPRSNGTRTSRVATGIPIDHHSSRAIFHTQPDDCR